MEMIKKDIKKLNLTQEENYYSNLDFTLEQAAQVRAGTLP